MRVVVVGAGLIGCACALALARRGAVVTVLERGAFSQHAASRAAAGILGAQLERHASGDMLELCVASRGRYPDWVGEIEAASGVSVDYRSCGTMRVAFTDAERAEIAAEVDAQRAAGHQAELLDGAAARRLEPALTGDVIAAASFPGDGVIDPPKLLEALRIAGSKAGVRLRCGVEVNGLVRRGDRVVGVCVHDEHGAPEAVSSDWVVVAAGSWSSLIADLEPMGIAPDLIVPARGQMIELRAPTAHLGRVVDAPGAYLSPRSDGRVLVGSTVELVGHERGVTASGARSLLDGALSVAPALGDAHLADSWCGFRALTADRLPILSAAPHDGLLLATGHFRNGVVLAPLTAEIIVDLAFGLESDVDLEPFSVERFALAVTRESAGTGPPTLVRDPSS
ncbi:MAG TPA: glycine oxidase ThiO [Polyangiaceae bacterium]|nr:glycine oxidase ThiO [Polyangiaceae bacterium]